MASLDSLAIPVDMLASENMENLSDLVDLEKENEKKLEEKYNSEEIIELKDEPKRNSIGLKTLSEMNGKDNLIIDLESGMIKPKKLTGPELLFQKYLKTQAKPKHKDTVCMNILSIENGKLENQKVEVRLDKEVELDHSRPGLSHEKLKENLRNQILHQRLEKLKQRFVKSETAEIEPEDKDHFPHKKEDSDEDYNPENDNSDEESAQESVDEEEDIVTQKKKTKSDGSKFLDEEAIDEDENEDDSDESESESSDEDENIQPSTTQKKSRILKAFEDSDDEEPKTTIKPQQTNELDNLQQENMSIDQNDKDNNLQNIKLSEDLFNSQATEFTFNEPSVSEEIDGNNINALFDTPSQAIDNEDDLMELCSGQFASTPSEIILTNNDFKFSQNVPITESQDDFSSEFISQIPENISKDAKSDEKVPDDDSFVMEVPENIENQQETIEKDVETDIKEVDSESNKINPIKNINKLLESTDDEAVENVEIKQKKLKKRMKKKDKIKKLGFSDDEDESDQNIVDTDLIDEESLIDEAEIDEPETYVDYDSEENEIQVKLTKKDRQKVASDYFEKEAELSEEEWHSDDEDEKGLDKYEMDLADEEEFDQNQLREEVGRIHARKMMDEDAKNLKKIEDLLFENEENDGVGRERKFRWKNQAEGFIMDENAQDVDDIDGEQEEENEIMWRRMRHERETLINEQSQKMADSDTISTDILLLDHSSQTVTTASTSTLVKRKFQIIKTNSPSIGLNLSSENSKQDSPFLIKAVSTKKFTHSSFLSRDEHTLTKIASFITTKDDEVTNLSSHGGNSMSFAPIEKKEEPNKKRKSEGSVKQDNSSGKKRKIENQRFLLDQLK